MSKNRKSYSSEEYVDENGKKAVSAAENFKSAENSENLKGKFNSCGNRDPSADSNDCGEHSCEDKLFCGEKFLFDSD